ncbi:YodO [Desulforapulum autotrophicum HRM2]|uniref:YodO n=1 Tax=Desulforapulum autotrophicum (strain ATCC 43914 / DSM 3382 / VKM B-1955 / HRM2) TaxID=177437 RepID=C0QJZ2_DESAH|nr:KamA family radical SAM protein [Desulforapulum autotrophicum]ACN16018.1 YodO [Desulforapulum autotrophicum HRM2]
MEEWISQMQGFINTPEKLRRIINPTPEELKAINTLDTRWGTTPYFAALMDPDDPCCPVRRQIIPSLKELENTYGIKNYLMFHENRTVDPERPDCIARQYQDRVAFTVTDTCASYCRHCFRREVVVDQRLKLRFDLDQGIKWIKKNKEIKDVLVTGGDPFLLSDQLLGDLITQLRQIDHVRMIRFGTRTIINLPQRITQDLMEILGDFHRVPIWINTQCNHPKEITDKTARAVFDLLRCGVNVGNQAVLLKGINDDVDTFRELHQKLVYTRIRPYYLFYCEAAPGIDHFRTGVEKGSQLIRDGLQGHTTGLARPTYVIATNIGKIPLMGNDYMIEKTEKEYRLRNYLGEETILPNIPDEQ